MRFQGPALAALLLACLLPLPEAEARPLDPASLPGLVISAGQVHSRRDDGDVGTGWFVDANYSRVFINMGTGHKQFGDDKIHNVYAGVGLAGVLQLQVGMGTEGQVQRIRHDFNLARFIEFVGGKKRNRYNQSLGTRFTLTFAAEEYKDDERFDNFHAGVGLLY